MPVSVDVPEGLKRAMEAEIEKGHYNSRSELIRDAIRRLLEDRGLVEDRELSDEAVESIKEALKQEDEGDVRELFEL